MVVPKQNYDSHSHEISRHRVNTIKVRQESINVRDDRKVGEILTSSGGMRKN